MDSSLSIWIGGLFNLAFFIFHIFFWKMFSWGEDLKKLLPVNRAVMQVLNLCLMFALLIFAYMSFFHNQEMLITPIGVTLTLFIALFWGIRAILQLVYFSRTKLVSYIFFVIFVIGFLLYLLPFLNS